MGLAVALLLVGSLAATAAAPPATAQATSEPTRFVVFGDFGQDNSGQASVAAAMKDVCARDGCDFVQTVGDIIYMSGVDSTSDSKLKSHFEDHYGDMGIPFYIAIGDHDAEGSIQAMVDYSDISETWTMPAPYYSHEHGNALFVVLNLYDSDSTQRAWAQETIAASQHDWVFVTGDMPLLANGKHGGALVEYGNKEAFIRDAVCGTDLYFSGDDHILAWYPMPDCGGTEQVVSGAGAAPRAIVDQGFDALYEKGDTLGFAWFEVNGGTLTGRFYDDDGNMLYERVLTKDVAGGGGDTGTDGGTGSDPAPDAGNDTTPEAPSIAWQLDDDIAANWVEVYLTPDDATLVEARVDGGDWQPLTPRTWGSWASSNVGAPNGSTVQFRASLADGVAALSPAYAWPDGAVVDDASDDDATGDDGTGDDGTDADDDLDPAGNDGPIVDGRDAPSPAGVLVALLLAGLGALRGRREQ